MAPGFDSLMHSPRMSAPRTNRYLARWSAVVAGAGAAFGLIERRNGIQRNAATRASSDRSSSEIASGGDWLSGLAVTKTKEARR